VAAVNARLVAAVKTVQATHNRHRQRLDIAQAIDKKGLEMAQAIPQKRRWGWWR